MSQMNPVFKSTPYEGVLPIWKPQHFTSHDVVAKLRKMIGLKRIGHTGTLDPLVTGVLPVCIGRATRLVEYIQDLPKEYEAELTVGFATDTDDASGQIINRTDATSVQIDQQLVDSVLKSFVGEIEQIPPMYSAVKINGQKLYALARAGIEIERNSRKVTIHRIEWLYTRKNADGYPTIGYRVLCSKGTYIRTLCSDIGKQLGYPAVMSNLIRTSSGGFLREDCLTFEQIQQLLDDGKLKEHIVSTPDSVRHLPAITLDNHNVFKAMNGQHISFVDTSNSSQSTLYRVFDDQNIFLGIFQYDSISQALIPVKVWRGEQ